MGLFKNKKIERPAGFFEVYQMKHISGLPIGNDLICVIHVTPDAYEFESIMTKQKIRLDRTKVVSVIKKFDVEKKVQMKSSLVGGVAGAAAFGVTGAIIGSRPKEKVKKEHKIYLSISYQNDGGIQEIIFEPNGFDFGGKMIENFNLNRKTSGTIEL